MDDNPRFDALPLQLPHLLVIQRKKSDRSYEGSRQNRTSRSCRCISNGTAFSPRCVLSVEYPCNYSTDPQIGPPPEAAAHPAADTTARAPGAASNALSRATCAALHACHTHGCADALKYTKRQPPGTQLLQAPEKEPIWGPVEGRSVDVHQGNAHNSSVSVSWGTLYRPRTFLEVQEGNRPNRCPEATAASPAAAADSQAQHNPRRRYSNPNSRSSSNSNKYYSSNCSSGRDSRVGQRASWMCGHQVRQRNSRQQEEGQRQLQRRTCPAVSDRWSCTRCCSPNAHLAQGRFPAVGHEAPADWNGRHVPATASAFILASTGDSASPVAAPATAGRGYSRRPPAATAAADAATDAVDQAVPGISSEPHYKQWNVSTAAQLPSSARSLKRVSPSSGDCGAVASRCGTGGAQLGPVGLEESQTACLGASTDSAQRSFSTSCCCSCSSSSTKATAGTRAVTTPTASSRHIAAPTRWTTRRTQQQLHGQQTLDPKEEVLDNRQQQELQQKQLVQLKQQHEKVQQQQAVHQHEQQMQPKQQRWRQPQLEQHKKPQQTIQQMQKKAQQQPSQQHMDAADVLAAVSYASDGAGGRNNQQLQQLQLQRQQDASGVFSPTGGAESTGSAAAAVATDSTAATSSDAAVAAPAAVATVASTASPVAAAAAPGLASAEQLSMHSCRYELELPYLQQRRMQQQKHHQQQETRHPQVQQRQLYTCIEHFCRVLQRSACRRPWRQLLLHAAQQHALQHQLQQQARTPGQQYYRANKQQQEQLAQEDVQQLPLLQKHQQGTQCLNVMEADLHSLSLRDEASSRDTCMRLEDYRRRLRQQQLRHKQLQLQQKREQRQQHKQQQQLIQQLATAAQELKKANDQQEALQGRLAAALSRLQQLEQQQLQQQQWRQGDPRVRA